MIFNILVRQIQNYVNLLIFKYSNFTFEEMKKINEAFESIKGNGVNLI